MTNVSSVWGVSKVVDIMWEPCVYIDRDALRKIWFDVKVPSKPEMDVNWKSKTLVLVSKCTHCKVKSHVLSECKSAKTMCKKCNKIGHFASNCKKYPDCINCKSSSHTLSQCKSVKAICSKCKCKGHFANNCM